MNKRSNKYHQSNDNYSHQARLDAVNLQDLAARFWGPGKRSGKAVMYQARWRSGDDHASFAVYTDGYKDFGSGEAGSPTQWVMREFGFSYADALVWLEDYLSGQGSSAPSVQRQTLDESPSEPPPAAWQAAMRAACQTTKAILWSPQGRGALEYLRSRRLSDAAISIAGLGYTPDYLKTGFTYIDEEGRQREVTIPPGIVIPWESDGALWAVRVRSRVGTFAKFLNIPEDRFQFGDRRGEVVDKYRSARGSKPRGALYGAHRLAPGKAVLFVEGEFDALAAAQAVDDQTAVVTFGSASSVPNRLPLRWRDRLKGAAQIRLLLDNDAAGHAAAARLSDALEAAGFPKQQIHRLQLPEGIKDISEWLEQGGALRSLTVSTQAPDSWLTALLHIGDGYGRSRGAGAPLYALFTRGVGQGIIDPDAFTIQQLSAAFKALGHPMSDRFLRAGVHVLLCLGFFSKLPSVPVDALDSSFEKNSPQAGRAGGRTADTFRLNSRDACLQALVDALTPRLRQIAYPAEPGTYTNAVTADLSTRAFDDSDLESANSPPFEATTHAAKISQFAERKRAAWRERQYKQRLIGQLVDSTATPLPEGWSLGSLAGFRVAFLRALKLHDRVGTTLTETALAIGISRRSVNDYVRDAGFEIETNQTYTVQISQQDISSAGGLEKYIRREGRLVQGKPISILVGQGDHERMEPYTSSAIEHMEKLIIAGEQISVIFQTANKHLAIVDATPPLPPVSKRPPGARRSPQNQGKEEQAVKEKSAPEQSPEPENHPNSEPQPEPPRKVELGPTGKEIRKPGYDPRWVHKQIKLRLKLMGWMQPDGSFVNPNTGEKAPPDADSAQLVALTLGVPVEQVRKKKPPTDSST